MVIIFGLTFIFLMTSLGSAFIFFVKSNLDERINKIFLGMASGIMLSASIWSLLVPAINYARDLNILPFIPTGIGFLGGALFIYLLDKLCLSCLNDENTVKKRSQKLFLAVTLHNIPEGFAVGLTFGLAISCNDISSMLGALFFSIGIGVQNIPEGLAISLPLYEQTKSKKKAFLLGVGSGIVEPIFGTIGLLLAQYIIYFMPYALAFAAGTMIYVVLEELIPESNNGAFKKYGTWSAIVGFVIMMILDLAF